MKPPAKHVPWGPGAAATPSAAQRSPGKEQGCQAHALLPLCMRVHILQGTQPPQAQAEGQAGKYHQNSTTSKQPEILYPPG